jgi:hypothetical protein
MGGGECEEPVSTGRECDKSFDVKSESWRAEKIEERTINKRERLIAF